MKYILIVIDMQNDFLTGSLANYDAERVTKNVVEKIQSQKWDRMFFTLDTHYENYLETSEGKYLPVEHCIHGSRGWKIDSDVFNATRSAVYDFDIVEKPTFGSTELAKEVEKAIREMEDIESGVEITIVGVCTDICVVSNALILKENNFIRENAKIVCDASCCSGLSEEKHKAALEVMKSCQIEVINE